MNKYKLTKDDQLGMSLGKAVHKLRKMILFSLVKEVGRDKCIRCGRRIALENFSIDHIIPWLDNSDGLFWDINNIGFSHLRCNVRSARRPGKGIIKHPSASAYRKGCRCDECKNIQKLKGRIYRASKKEIIIK